MTTATAPQKSPNFVQRADALGRATGPNFALAHIGRPEDLMRYGVRHPAIGQTVSGKVFLQELLGLTGMEISFGLMPAQTSIPFYHKHQQNEEVYLILSGHGQFQVDGEVMEVSEGSAVRVSPNGVRAFRNTSDEPMFYVVIQAKEGSLERWTATDGIGVPGPVQWPVA